MRSAFLKCYSYSPVNQITNEMTIAPNVGVMTLTGEEVDFLYEGPRRMALYRTKTTLAGHSRTYRTSYFTEHLTRET